MTAAASVTFFRPEFGDFLYATVGSERNEMPLTVLSALSRLGVDPWKVAAELSELPRESAAQRLALLLARLPGERWAQSDPKDIAGRLIERLPHRGPLDVRLSNNADGVQRIFSSPVVLICIALVFVVLIAAIWFEQSARNDNVEAPAFSRVAYAKFGTQLALDQSIVLDHAPQRDALRLSGPSSGGVGTRILPNSAVRPTRRAE